MRAKAELEERGYAAGEQTYTYKLTSPRTADWILRLSMPHRFDMRVAAGSHGMAEPTVTAGRHRNTLKPLDDSGIPKALLSKTREVIRHVMETEHANALAHGTPPTPGRVTWYHEKGYTLTTEQAAEADRITSIIDGVFHDQDQAIAAAVKIALSTVPLKEHERQISALQSDLAHSIKPEVQTTHVVSSEGVHKIHGDTSLIMSRLHTRDFVGTYGNDDIEKVIDLMEPLVEQIERLHRSTMDNDPSTVGA